MRKTGIRIGWLICLTGWLMGCASAPKHPVALGHHGMPPVATYSIVAFDPVTGDLGVAVQSKFFGVGSVVPWAKAKVGAIATQAYANVSYGSRGLELLQAGKSPKEVVQQLTEADSERELRQLGVIDAQGNAAGHTGSKCNEWAGHTVGTNFCVQGNILASGDVLKAMTEAYEKARLVEGTELADWLLAALQAAEKAGGDRRGRQSAALLVVREEGGFDGRNDRYVDLRVEDNPEPLDELARLLILHKRFYAYAHQHPPKRVAAPVGETKSEKKP